MLSEKNVLFQIRENHYTPEMYEQGFTMAFSKVRRNETSPLVYHKTMNYGDCILEKRAVRGSDIQEPVFLNTRGEIAEGATSNLFFVKDGTLHTPEISSGLLPGILRRWVLETGKKEGLPVVERRIRPEEVKTFEECFVTNSLLGIMPVSALEDVKFQNRNITEGWMERYEKAVVPHS